MDQRTVENAIISMEKIRFVFDIRVIASSHTFQTAELRTQMSFRTAIPSSGRGPIAATPLPPDTILLLSSLLFASCVKPLLLSSLPNEKFAKRIGCPELPSLD